MSKFLLLILIVGIFSKPNFLSFAEENSKELELTEMKTTAYTNNMKWVGFSLPSPSVITKIAWSKKNTTTTPNEMFGMFQGANEEDFIDAVPLAMLTEASNPESIEIDVKTPFKYIRYMSPLKKEVTFTDFEVYGYKAKDSEEVEENLYQPTNIPLIVINTGGKMNFQKKKKIQIVI